jgi:hypothetical protein
MNQYRFIKDYNAFYLPQLSEAYIKATAGQLNSPPPQYKNYKVGDLIVASFDETNSDKNNVYTTLDGGAPDFAIMGQTIIGIPISNLEEISIGSGLSTTAKWGIIIGVTLTAWTLLYYTQKKTK